MTEHTELKVTLPDRDQQHRIPSLHNGVKTKRNNMATFRTN